MAWPWAGRRLRLSLRLLSRLVCAVEQQTVTQMEAQAQLQVQLDRIATALEVWTAPPDDGVEEPVPPLDQVLQRMSAQVAAAANPRAFRTATPVRGDTTVSAGDPGGITYRDSSLLYLAAQVEAGLVQALGRPPTDEELADALAIAEGRRP